MEYIAVCTLLYAIFIFADIKKAAKTKQTKVLKFSLPVYAVTFVINIMIGLGMKVPSLNMTILKVIQSLFKIKV